MHKWILICAGILLLIVAILVFQYFRKGTVYIVHDSGYTAFSTHDQIVHRANEKQFERVIQCFFPGDRFDMLWVSRQNDLYSGIVLILESGNPKLSVSFKTASQQAELAAFKKAMSDANFVAKEDSESFNGGETEEYRITNLEYALPISSEAVLKAVHTALGQLQPKESGDYFLSAWLMANGPGAGRGIQFRPTEDPLKEILENF